jgi:hypothetical protein
LCGGLAMLTMPTAPSFSYEIELIDLLLRGDIAGMASHHCGK